MDALLLLSIAIAQPSTRLQFLFPLQVQLGLHGQSHWRTRLALDAH